MQLGIILTSLQDNAHVASLLGFSQSSDMTHTGSKQQRAGPSSNMHLAEILMKTLLQNLGYHFVSTCIIELNCQFSAFNSNVSNI